MSTRLNLHQAVVGQRVVLSNSPTAPINSIVEVDGREVRLLLKEKNELGEEVRRWHSVVDCYLPTEEQENNDLIQK